MSYQDGYRFVTVHTHGDFIVLPHLNTRPPAPWPASHSVTLSWHWANQSLPNPNNAKHQARKRQVLILKSLVWLDKVLNLWAPDSNLRPLDSLTLQSGRRALYSLRCCITAIMTSSHCSHAVPQASILYSIWLKRELIPQASTWLPSQQW